MPRATPGALPAIAVAPDAAGDAGARGLASVLIETGKPGITRLVVITATLGFAMTALGRGDWAAVDVFRLLAGTLLGTGLAASGANALNMWLEAPRDARMDRTKNRPLPSGRASPNAVLAFGVGASALGVAALALLCGPVPALLGLASVALYVLVYTPLKPVTVWSTLIGAVPGALPPLIGAAAASPAPGFAAALDPMGLAIFSMMVVWQIPHFYAIASVYRDDYARGGLRVLPALEPDGRLTVAVSLAATLALLPLTMLPAVVGGERLGPPYLAFAAISWLAFAWLVVRWSGRRTVPAARAVFIASVTHLPLLMAFMVVESLARVVLAG